MKNINAKYKILAMIPLFMLVGCKKHDIHEHKNIVTGLVTIGNHRVILLEDIESCQERICKLNDAYSNTAFLDDFDYFCLADTLTITTGGEFLSEGYYQDNIFLNDGFLGMKYNNDSIAARKQRGQINIFKQDIKQKTR